MRTMSRRETRRADAFLSDRLGRVPQVAVLQNYIVLFHKWVDDKVPCVVFDMKNETVIELVECEVPFDRYSHRSIFCV
ncbi:MAG: hypothetical protein WC483_00060 [Candidatus Paceibacterota bacterium]